MLFYIDFSWTHFCIAFGVALLISFIMTFQTRNFYLMHVVIRKFSIIDFEFPASASELVSHVKNIFSLPAQLAKRSLTAFRSQLYIDFLFMPAAYGSVFILCMKVSSKLISFGHNFFIFLAWLQLISWLFDIIENIYLLNKVRPNPVVSSSFVQLAYTAMEIVKWAIPLVAIVCSMAALFYFWLGGRYYSHSLYYVIVILIELTVFFALKKLTSKTEKQTLQNFSNIS
jgi:hypothetical protein